MQEQWVELDEFPGYSVSDKGRVRNDSNGRLLNPSYNAGGVLKVNLSYDGKRHTRSVKILVAKAFVKGQTEIFNCPINLDGDPGNNCVYNLMWRPRWFAWKYTRQFVDQPLWYPGGPMVDLDFGEIIDDDSGIVYEDIYQAATQNGVLFKDVWRGVFLSKRAFPTNQLFRLHNS